MSMLIVVVDSYWSLICAPTSWCHFQLFLFVVVMIVGSSRRSTWVLMGVVAVVLLTIAIMSASAEAKDQNNVCANCTKVGRMSGFCKVKNETGGYETSCVTFTGVKCKGCSASDCYVWQCKLNVLVLVYVIVPVGILLFLFAIILCVYCCCCRSSTSSISSSSSSVYRKKESKRDTNQRREREKRQEERRVASEKKRNHYREKYGLLENAEV
eukprot:m.103541 g.103541  ORF g.103541 m.103541 type:complete len:212 (-) comp9096_c7_seq1:48-683(-)